MILTGWTDGKLRCFDGETGELLWTLADTCPPTPTHPGRPPHRSPESHFRVGRPLFAVPACPRAPTQPRCTRRKRRPRARVPALPAACSRPEPASVEIRRSVRIKPLPIRKRPLPIRKRGCAPPKPSSDHVLHRARRHPAGVSAVRVSHNQRFFVTGGEEARPRPRLRPRPASSRGGGVAYTLR